MIRLAAAPATDSPNGPGNLILSQSGAFVINHFNQVFFRTTCHSLLYLPIHRLWVAPYAQTSCLGAVWGCFYFPGFSASVLSAMLVKALCVYFVISTRSFLSIPQHPLWVTIVFQACDSLQHVIHCDGIMTERPKNWDESSSFRALHWKRVGIYFSVQIPPTHPHTHLPLCTEPRVHGVGVWGSGSKAGSQTASFTTTI